MAKSHWGLRDRCGYGGSTRAQLALAILANTAFMKISTIADLPPQLALEWMRRLRDGKLVEAHWVLFWAVVVPPGTSPEQVDLLRAPLFAGAHTMRADVIALRSPPHHRTLFSQTPSARLGPQAFWGPRDACCSYPPGRDNPISARFTKNGNYSRFRIRDC
jgi:hypothetical protein